MLKYQSWRFVLSLGVLACGPEVASRVNDVAIDRGSGYLFWLEGGDLAMARCDGGPLHDRSTCSFDKKRFYGPSVFDDLSNEVGKGLAAEEAKVRALSVVMTRLETQIVELLSTPSLQPQLDALKEQIAAKEISIVKVEAKLKTLDTQIAGLVAKLAGSSDLDLRLQLAERERERVGVATEREKLTKDIESLRSAYIATASGAVSGDLLKELEVQRQERKKELTATRARVDSLYAEKVAYARLLNLIGRDGVTYDILESSASFQIEKGILKNLWRLIEKWGGDYELAFLQKRLDVFLIAISGTYDCETFDHATKTRLVLNFSGSVAPNKARMAADWSSNGEPNKGEILQCWVVDRRTVSCEKGGASEPKLMFFNYGDVSFNSGNQLWQACKKH